MLVESYVKILPMLGVTPDKAVILKRTRELEGFSSKTHMISEIDTEVSAMEKLYAAPEPTEMSSSPGLVR